MLTPCFQSTGFNFVTHKSRLVVASSQLPSLRGRFARGIRVPAPGVHCTLTRTWATQERIGLSLGYTAAMVLPNAGSIKGVLFDIDGTLTDSDYLHFVAFQDLLAERGYNGGEKITREFFDEFISGGHNSYLGGFLWPDLPPEQQAAFMEDKEEVFRNKAAGILEPVKGLKDFLAWVDANGLRKAAVSNAPRQNVHVMLQALGLGSYFETIILGEDTPRPKPFPDPYLAGLQFFGLQPDDVIVVEDSPAGVTAGKAANIPTVGILTSQAPERLLAAGATITVKDYHELLEHVLEGPS